MFMFFENKLSEVELKMWAGVALAANFDIVVYRSTKIEVVMIF